MPAAISAVLVKDIVIAPLWGVPSRVERSTHREHRIDVLTEMPSLHRIDRAGLSSGGCVQFSYGGRDDERDFAPDCPCCRTKSSALRRAPSTWLSVCSRNGFTFCPSLESRMLACSR